MKPLHMTVLLTLAIALVGCKSYVKSTPSKTIENEPANYVRVFREAIPADVTVVNSVIVTYTFRPGVVTTDDFEFELLAPQSWIRKQSFDLKKDNDEFMQRELGVRRENARPWYAPKPIDQYDLYRDWTSVGYFHMLVEKVVEADGRQRVFVSKH